MRLATLPDGEARAVETIMNGEVRAENTVGIMPFAPDEFVRSHSQGLALCPPASPLS